MQYWKSLDAFASSSDDKLDDFMSLLEEDLENSQRVLLLLDIAKRYFSVVEAEILFLFLKNRRNKDISLILGIQEPEVARFKKIIIKKAAIYYKFCYVIDISCYKEHVIQTLNLNDKQAEIFRNFLDFRSLSYIGTEVGSKSSNMHRSLNSIRRKIEEALPDHPEFKIVLDFFDSSKYINNSNKSFTIIDDLV